MISLLHCTIDIAANLEEHFFQRFDLMGFEARAARPIDLCDQRRHLLHNPLARGRHAEPMGASVGLVVLAGWARARFGIWLIPGRSLVAATLVAICLHGILSVWSPEGWWVFLYGAALLAVGLAVLAAVRALPRP